MRRALARAGLVLASVIVSLAAAELVVRWTMPPPRIQIAYEALDPTHTDNAAGTESILVTTPQGLRLRPNSVALITRHRVSDRETTLRTNSLGLRGPELDRGTGTRRILFLGDSITVGDHLPEDETYVSMIEELAAGLGGTWQAVNAGISSTSAEDYLALLTAIGPEVGPDVVVVGLFLNDYRRSLSVRAAAPPPWLAGSWLVCHLLDGVTAARESSTERAFLAEHSQRLASGRAEIEESFAAMEPAHALDPRFKDLVLAANHDWGGAWTGAGWSRIETALAGIKEVSDSLGAPSLVMLFPVRVQVESVEVFDYPQRRARAACERLDMEFLDVLPRFRAAAAAVNEPLFYDHCHTTAFGNSLIAEEFWNFFSASLPAPTPALDAL